MDNQPVVPNIAVAGNVEGSIVIGDNNFVVNSNYGTIVYKQAVPQARLRDMVPRPPRAPRGLIGRAKEIAELNGRIANREALLVQGAEGMGKTALVKQAANGEAASGQPNGVVFLEGIDQSGLALSWNDILQLLFDALFESDPPLKVTFASARTYLSNTSPLVLLDNLKISAEALESLVDLFPQAAITVVPPSGSRSDAFETVNLGPLPMAEASQLLAARLGITMEDADPAMLEKICDQLNGVPLALVTIAKTAKENGLHLETIHQGLESIQLEATHLIKAAIERSYRFAASFLNNEQGNMVALTAAAPGMSADRGWLETSAGGVTTSQALEGLGILQPNSPRLRLHLEYTAYALENRDVNALREQLLTWLQTQLEARWQDFDFVRAEAGNLLGLTEWLAGQSRWQAVATLGRLLDPFLTLRGWWDAWKTNLEHILNAARALGDTSLEAWALHQLGTRALGLGQNQEATAQLQQALAIRQELNDPTAAAYTQHNLNLLLPANVPPVLLVPAKKSSRLPLFATMILLLLIGGAVLAGFAYRNDRIPGFLYSTLTLTPSLTATPTFTPTSTATATATATPTLTYTPTLTPTFTSTPTPSPTLTRTPTQTRTPTSSVSPTITLTPTFALPIVQALMQAYCRYGPGDVYLPADDLFPGDLVQVNGHNGNGTWLYVQKQANGRFCWAAASTLEPLADKSGLLIMPVNLPFSTDTPLPQNVQATRKNDQVTLTWDQVHINLGDARGYLLDVRVCQNGLRVPLTIQTDNTSYTFTDGPGCSKLSSGKIYAVTVRGYSQPVDIPWPAP